jgi:hypothetical protein
MSQYFLIALIRTLALLRKKTSGQLCSQKFYSIDERATLVIFVQGPITSAETRGEFEVGNKSHQCHTAVFYASIQQPLKVKCSSANADEAFGPNGSVPPAPLWRGHRMVARFEGLEEGVIRPDKST